MAPPLLVAPLSGVEVSSGNPAMIFRTDTGPIKKFERNDNSKILAPLQECGDQAILLSCFYLCGFQFVTPSF
jgi:hypothetical protein